MSDEESFVILGSCSLRSNESLRSGFGSLEQSKIEMDSVQSGAANRSLNDKDEIGKMSQSLSEQRNGHLNSLEKSNEREQTLTNSVNKNIEKIADNANNTLMERSAISVVTSVKNDDSSTVSTNENSMKNDGEMKEKSYETFEKLVNKAMQKSSDSEKSVPNANSTTMERSVNSSGTSAKTDGSLAASFILGEVQADVLKSSVYSQFPSLCSMESCAEDISKLQNLMSEYIELKSTLNTVNGTMRQFYIKTQQWRDDMHKTERQYKEQLQNCQHEIAMLRNENINLRQEMISKVEQMNAFEGARKKEVAELTQSVSEKTTIIEIMRSQIARLEKQQLAQENDTKDHAKCSEHLLAIKELERKMSTIVAENYELKDMKKMYLDEINCLKVNVVSADELLRQAKKDIDLLKTRDIEKSQLFENYEKEREELREEMGLLRQQVEVYSKDFQMERTARESLAGEKEQLLQDLRAMQRANQQLIEEQQRRLEIVKAAQANGGANATVPAAPPQVSQRFIAKPPSAAAFQANIQQRPIRPLPQPTPAVPSRFSCPVCSQGFDSLTVLQSHVNMCLDKA